MDLLSEESGGPRALTARHVSADKALSEPNISNRNLLCHSYSVYPDFYSYFTALHAYAWVIWCCGAVLLLTICVLYYITLRSAAKHWRQSTSSLAAVIAVYPVVGAAGLIALLVPRARLLSEAIAQEVVMIAMYQFYCLMITECGGSKQLISRGDLNIETRVMPCCCWPCCIIPRPKVSKKSLTWLRYLVLQLPVVQTIIYIIILVLWAEDMVLYNRGYSYIQMFVGVSIISGMWGVIMSVRVAESIGLRPRPRFVALQLVLLIVKLQCGLVKIFPEVLHIPCYLDVHPSVFVHLIHNSLMIVEMLLLSIWAWRLYRVAPEKVPEKLQPVVVTVMEDTKDGVDNKYFSDELK